jgi:hypothetical protein
MKPLLELLLTTTSSRFLFLESAEFELHRRQETCRGGAKENLHGERNSVIEQKILSGN